MFAKMLAHKKLNKKNRIVNMCQATAAARYAALSSRKQSNISSFDRCKINYFRHN